MTAAAHLEDRRFRCMGGEHRVLAEGPGAAHAAATAEELLHALDRRLTRFDERSELCRLNADPRKAVPASPLLRGAVRAALDAARATRGLVDPTLLGPLETAGYATSRDGVRAAPLSAALFIAPQRRPARPARSARWRMVAVDDDAGTIIRPPGVRLDLGGIGKGLAADLVAARLAGFRLTRFAIDCAGDVRVGGAEIADRPLAVDVQHPLTHEPVLALALGGGAIATSGLDARLWRRPDGRYAHHLLDPSTGRPAWTGLIGATALAPTAAEAETRAKAALLAGPAGAREHLDRHGGLIVADDGTATPIGPLRPPVPAIALAPYRKATA
jgi:thiamine biosynthesis lipoprotein